MRRSLKILSIVVLVIIIVAGILITHFAQSSPYTAMQNKGIGSNVTVSGSKVPTSVKATIDHTAQLSFSSMQPLGPVFQVTPAGTLPAPITLRFKLSQQATTGGLVLIASRETQNGSWMLEQSTVSADGWYASVQTTHLSWWQPLWYDLKEAATLFKQDVLDGISGDFLTEAEKPQCDNEAQATQDNYAITSSAKKTLYWCFGVENGERILKVVNRARYPLEVTHPGFTAKSTGLPPFELDQLARFASGKDSIIYPFEEMDFSVDLKPSTKAFISTEFSGLAQSLYQLQVGVTTAIQFITQFGAGVGVPVNGAINPTKLEKIIQYIDDHFLSRIECASAVKTFKVGNILAACFDPEKMFETFGWAGFLLSPLTIAGSLMEFFRSELDSIGAIIKGDDRYKILVSRFDSTTASSFPTPVPTTPTVTTLSGPAGVITEFPLTNNIWNTGGITLGPDGNLWFTENGQIATITPQGSITNFPVPSGGSHLNGITTGSDGNLWFAEDNGIGRITPSGTITEFPIPPDDYVPLGGPFDITAGPDGNLWFTEGNAKTPIGRITPAGAITEFPVPNFFGGSINSITAGPDGNLWFTETDFAAYGSPDTYEIGRMTPDGKVTQFPLPSDLSGPGAITLGPDGNLWFTAVKDNGANANSAGWIGSITPSGKFGGFPVPNVTGGLSWITIGPDGNLWFTESNDNRIGQITPAGAITEFSLPNNNGTAPNVITSRPNGTLWFAGMIGEIGCITSGT